jgi:hypothetical protein
MDIKQRYEEEKHIVMKIADEYTEKYFDCMPETVGGEELKGIKMASMQFCALLNKMGGNMTKENFKEFAGEVWDFLDITPETAKEMLREAQEDLH